jgi:hypothetical protein
MADYSRYSDFVSTLDEVDGLKNFKRHSDHTYMLEHVDERLGFEYLQCIRHNTNISSDRIKKYCDLNDRLGDPNMFQYDTIRCSPTSLRYIFHSHLILSHIKSLTLPSVDIVEVGGGYGGLCIALHHFAETYGVKISSYKILDLPSISKLQRIYIHNVDPSINVEVIDANTYGESIPLTNAFMVSNYCFSEISESFREKYIQHLIPKIAHGFMAWNWIPVFDFGFKTTVEKEYPNTCDDNRYVYF